MKSFALSLVLGLSSFSVLAGETPTIPEPGSLSLLGIGAVGALAIWARNRKKK